MSSFQRTTARLLGAPLAIGLFLSVAGCGGGSSSGGGGGAPPTVSSVSPAAGATGVPTNTSFNATFSGPMNPATITPTTFKLTGPGSTPVSGDVTFVDLTSVATFEPSGALTGDTLYTATLTTGITDLGGTPLASDFVWTFRTGLTADTTPPVVTFTVPARGATGVATNSKATATFNESMDPSTIKASTFVLANGASATGDVVYADAGKTATLTPDQDLLVNTEYTATLTTQVRDLAGNALSVAYVWTFTTGSNRDTSRPTVTSTNPANNATNVPRNKKVNATFSEAMDPATLTTQNYRLAGPGTTSVAGTISYDPLSKVTTFSPLTDLASNTLFTATVTTGVKDAAGNALANDKVWTFTTGANNANQGAQPVNLGSAANFAVLAGSAVTNTGATEIFGNVGLHPGSSVGGFPPGVIHGVQEIGTPTALAAKGDLTTAYTDAQGRVNPIVLANNNLGGLTLAPGVYVSATDLMLSGTGPQAILTLDAQGDSTAVWIFQCKAAFLTTSGTSIVLSGGAKAANVFWAVGSRATLGTTTTFYGTILAETAVNLSTGATLTGRALAQSAEVTLEGNTITLPSP
jgi:hypothetical protein